MGQEIEKNDNFENYNIVFSNQTISRKPSGICGKYVFQIWCFFILVRTLK